MRNNRRRQMTGLLLVAVVLVAVASPPLQSLANSPREMRLVLGEEQELDFLGLPLSAVVRSDRDGVIRINGQTASAGRWTVDLSHPLALRPIEAGRCQLELALFGVVPLRRISVEVVPRLSVSPGGQSIGILLRTKGVTVVGHAPVEGSDGQTGYPARDAGIRVGDVILKVDGVEVTSSQHVVFLVNRCAREGRPAAIEVTRGEAGLRFEVAPVYSERERIFQVGLYVRDGAAGVGTLTFYDERTGVFMALGHVISDSTTSRPLAISDGRVVRASVAHVRPGRRGDPGEKEGTFVEDQDVIGRITANTEFGLVGVVTQPAGLQDGTGVPPDDAMPVALAREVTVGAAEIRTVVDGTKVETFSVEIIRVDTSQTGPAPKGITLRVTDPALLETTGGIVQGMSGSPIIQNGRLVGAVTHVFVNDPTRGYGVFAEWMVREAGLAPAGTGLLAQPATSAADPAALSAAGCR